MTSDVNILITSCRIILLVVFNLFICGCDSHRHDKTLLEISMTVSDYPETALQRLDSINTDRLSEHDRHLYDFLTVKARDKAYIYHTSDSLILDVLDYTSSHDKSYHPEALYYGGRVYSDLGDYPTALKYFQQALDHLPPNTKDLNLRSRVLSQSGRLLNTLRLYKEAVSYTEQALRIAQQKQDTLNILYELQLLGNIHLRAGNYDMASTYLKEALNLGTDIPLDDQTITKIYLARTEYKIGRIDSALLLIRGIPELADPVVYNGSLSTASNIYLKAGVLDTAYLYADKLIHSSDPAHKEVGYQVILSPQLRSYLPSDSLDTYISAYRGLLEESLNLNESQLSVIQQALYNYQLHERERMKAEASKNKFRSWLIVTLCGLAFLIFIILYTLLYFKNRTKSRIIHLQQALYSIYQLNERLTTAKTLYIGQPHITQISTGDGVDTGRITIEPSKPLLLTYEPKPTENDLREKLRNELMSLAKNYNGRIPVQAVILKSAVYEKLQDLISHDKVLKDHDPIWKEVEMVVAEASPDFKIHLNLLTAGKLSTLDLHTALLVKCGIKPSQMMVLFGKSNGTINSRRETLATKIFDKKVSVKEIDRIIRLL